MDILGANGLFICIVAYTFAVIMGVVLGFCLEGIAALACGLLLGWCSVYLWRDKIFTIVISIVSVFTAIYFFGTQRQH